MTITDSARRLALVAVVAMLAALLPISGAFAQDPAPGDPIALDLDGQTAVEYSVRWSQVVYDADTLAGDGAPDTALIGRDDVFADSLASGVLQGASDNGSPLLLTPSNALSEDTAAELERLGVENVTILGLEAAISEDVEAELEELGYTVDRQGGQTRIETAIDIAEDIDSDTALLARAFGTDEETQAFADSLAAGGWAAEADFPVLLTQTEVLTGNTAAHLEAAGYTNIIIIGGEAAVSAEVEASAGEFAENVSRVGGGTRFETAVAIAEARGYASPDDAEGVILVDGQVDSAWADGFPAANLSGRGWPIVLSNSADDSLPEPTRTWLEGDTAFASEHLTDVVLICGSTVPDDDDASGSDQCGEAAEILGATVVDFVPPGEEPEPVDNAGIVTACRNSAGEVDFTSEAGEAVTVEYDTTGDDADTFIVDGTEATPGAWQAECGVGDFLTVTTNDDGTLTLSLENRDEDFYTEGTVGNVDQVNDEYDIIEPVSGVPLRVDVGYMGDLLFVDGAPATSTTFESDINEGDSIAIDEDAVGNESHSLTNEAVTGTVEDADAPASDPMQFMIDNLGDDHLDDANDTHYEAASADSANEVYIVDGEDEDFSEFAAEISDGDQITYTREGNEETFNLVNQAPNTVSGTATEDISPSGAFNDGGSLVIVGEDGNDVTVPYTSTARIIIDGQLATEEEFEDDSTTESVNAGDEITHTPADAASGQSEILTLNNSDLTGIPTGIITDGVGMAGTYDVENAAGGVIYEDVPYDDPNDSVFRNGADADRWFVDGVEQTEALFEDALNDCDPAADNDCTITVVNGALAAEHRLDTDSSDNA